MDKIYTDLGVGRNYRRPSRDAGERWAGVHMRAFTSLVISCLCLMLAATRAGAVTTPGDLIVIARALSFIENPLKGEVTVGIVYVPSNAQSNADAENVRKMLGDGLKVGDVTLKPELVKLEDVGSAAVGLFFLTDGVGAAASKLAVATRTRHLLCVTIDAAQVQSGACVMSVRSQPKIEILVNRDAAAASGTAFASIFRMMITEL